MSTRQNNARFVQISLFHLVVHSFTTGRGDRVAQWVERRRTQDCMTSGTRVRTPSVAQQHIILLLLLLLLLLL